MAQGKSGSSSSVLDSMPIKYDDALALAGDDSMNGAEFKRLRLSLGITTSDLGDIFGKPQSTISKWENGMKIANARIIRLAFRALGANVD